MTNGCPIYSKAADIAQAKMCAYILCLIMYIHTGNLYCDAEATVHISILLTKKQIISIQTQHPQLGFTFIISLEVVLLME